MWITGVGAGEAARGAGRAVVTAHGGSVKVTSRPGDTAFLVRLPTAPAPGSVPLA